MGGTRKGAAHVADVATRQLLFVLSSRRASCVSEAIGGLMFNNWWFEILVERSFLLIFASDACRFYLLKPINC